MMVYKRFISLYFCIGFFFLQSCAEDTYSLHVQTRQGQSVNLNFIHKPVITFEKDSVVISTVDLKLLFCYEDAVLSFVDKVPSSINDSHKNAIFFSINRGIVIGKNIPSSCAVRFYSMRGDFLGESMPDHEGIVRYNVNNIRDKFIIVNTGQVGLNFKIILP